MQIMFSQTKEFSRLLVKYTISHNNIKRAVKSYTMSKRYINTMLRATIINILYHRLDVDESEFSTKTFNDIPFKSFKPKSKNYLIREFHAYMTACKHAIEKNYLREFYLYFIDSESEDILENYKFSFNYSDKQDEKISQNENNLTDSTCELLQNLNDLGRHNKLSSEIQLKVEFTYFEDTPEEYEPPGFRGIDESESLIKKLNKNGNAIEIGKLYTGFHMLKCRGRGEIFNFNESETMSNLEIENAPPENAPPELMTEDYTLREQESNVVSVNKDLLTEDLSPVIQEGSNNPSNTVNLPTANQSSNKLNDTYISQCIDLEGSDSEESHTDCPCRLPTRIGEWIADKIKCDKCNRIFHTACQGYIDNTYLAGVYRCLDCREEKDNDSILCLFRGEKSKPVHRIRYIMACAYKMAGIPRELQTVFKETTHNLQLTEIGKQLKFNMDLLKTLFKFDHKEPDKNKLILNHK